MNEFKEFYNIKQLSEEPLFPYKTRDKIEELINNGQLKAKNINKEGGTYKKYIISKQSIIDFLS